MREAPAADSTDARDVRDGQGDDLECMETNVDRDGVDGVDGDVVARDSSDQNHDGAQPCTPTPNGLGAVASCDHEASVGTDTISSASGLGPGEGLELEPANSDNDSLASGEAAAAVVNLSDGSSEPPEMHAEEDSVVAGQPEATEADCPPVTTPGNRFCEFRWTASRKCQEAFSLSLPIWDPIRGEIEGEWVEQRGSQWCFAYAKEFQGRLYAGPLATRTDSVKKI